MPRSGIALTHKPLFGFISILFILLSAGAGNLLMQDDLTLSVATADAQTAGLEPVLASNFGDITNLVWSADSQRLAFTQPPTSELVAPGAWHEFDLATRTLTTGDIWPFQPTLTPTEEQIFSPAVRTDGTRGFIHESPDGRFLAYLDNPAVAVTGNLMVANRPLAQKTRIDNFLSNAFAPPFAFQILWNEVTTAFAIEVGPARTGLSVAGLFRNFDPDVNATEFVLTRFLTIGSDDLVLLDAFDVSNGGDQILQLMSERDTSLPAGQQLPQFRLVVYEVDAPTSSRVIEVFTRINGASFAPNDDTKVLAVTEQGLVEYDLTTDTFVVLNADVNTSWVDEALFSPDGTAVVLYENPDSGPDSLFVELVADLSGQTPPVACDNAPASDPCAAAKP